jgi:hypothetical protein
MNRPWRHVSRALLFHTHRLIFRLGLQLVLEATATVVFLDKDYRPTRVFPEVASKMRLHFF